jgi:hypothetical protein
LAALPATIQPSRLVRAWCRVGPRLRKIADIAANDGEVRLAGRKHFTRGQRGACVDDCQSHGSMIVTSRLAIVDITLAASPSIEPTATVNVTGRV